MKKLWKKWRTPLVLLALLALYPAFVVGYTWSHVFRSDLEGGRHGPLDAYRHALASAVVAYTLGEPCVTLTTAIMEHRDRPANRMDRHNNRIGARIGATARTFADLEPTVRQAVSEGTLGTERVDQITWLPKERWRKSRAW